MNIIVCLDDNNGMMFNKRRQSRDSFLIRRICEITAGAKLFVNGYSSSLFEDCAAVVCEDFLLKAKAGDYCFVENIPLKDYEEKIEKIIVYRWNRIYPSDMKFDIELDILKLSAKFRFVGSSHEKITEEVYTR